MEVATRQQLLQIALHEDCDLELKWQAISELEYRKWHDDMLLNLVKLWGAGKSVMDISMELDVAETIIRSRLKKYGLYGRRVAS